jgi:hypothetical protein
MPFIETSRDEARQESLRRLAGAPGAMAAVAGALGLLPRWLRRAAIATVERGMDADALDTTVALLRHDAVRVAFTMGQHEFQDLDAGDSWQNLSHFAERCASSTPYHSRHDD